MLAFSKGICKPKLSYLKYLLCRKFSYTHFRSIFHFYPSIHGLNLAISTNKGLIFGLEMKTPNNCI